MKIIPINLSLCLTFIGGILPVGSVALHSLGWIPIQHMVLPNLLLLSICCYQLTNVLEIRNMILTGWMAGLIAVTAYDLSRIPFIYAGWNDFIPKIGGWLSGSEDNFLLGYIWRYAGNGAGLGLCFSILHYLAKFKHIVLAGTLFGLSVFLCLDLVLILSKHAQGLMFELTPLNFIGSLTGHIVYGFVLGWVLSKSTSHTIRKSHIS